MGQVQNTTSILRWHFPCAFLFFFFNILCFSLKKYVMVVFQQTQKLSALQWHFDVALIQFLFVGLISVFIPLPQPDRQHK